MLLVSQKKEKRGIDRASTLTNEFDFSSIQIIPTRSTTKSLQKHISWLFSYLQVSKKHWCPIRAFFVKGIMSPHCGHYIPSVRFKKLVVDSTFHIQITQHKHQKMPQTNMGPSAQNKANRVNKKWQHFSRKAPKAWDLVPTQDYANGKGDNHRFLFARKSNTYTHIKKCPVHKPQTRAASLHFTKTGDIQHSNWVRVASSPGSR